MVFLLRCEICYFTNYNKNVNYLLLHIIYLAAVTLFSNFISYFTNQIELFHNTFIYLGEGTQKGLEETVKSEAESNACWLSISNVLGYNGMFLYY